MCGLGKVGSGLGSGLGSPQLRRGRMSAIPAAISGVRRAAISEIFPPLRGGGGGGDKPPVITVNPARAGDSIYLG